jgi:hypothetical protein
MRGSAISQDVADLPVEAHGGLRHHKRHGEAVVPIFIGRGATPFPDHVASTRTTHALPRQAANFWPHNSDRAADYEASDFVRKSMVILTHLPFNLHWSHASLLVGMEPAAAPANGH